MSLWQVVLLALIQAATEFLPVSSSGHLVVAQKLFGLTHPPIFFDIMIHGGTLVAVLVYFHKDLARLAVAGLRGLRPPSNPGLGHLWQQDDDFRLLAWLGVASLPIAAVGLLFENNILVVFDSLQAVGAALILTAVLLLLTTRFPKGEKALPGIGLKEALLIGSFQASAILPGVSRSGSTIASGLFGGLRRADAFAFSFLLSVPAIIGALLLKLDDAMGLDALYLAQSFLGAIIAGVAGYLALKLLARVVMGGRLFLFGWYCAMLGIVLVVLR